MQRVSPGLATCDSVQGVPAKGILDSSATCATTMGNPDTGRSESSRQLAAMPIPAVRRRRRRAAAPAAEENTPLKTVDDSQGSSVSSEAVAAGGDATDDSMDVGQASPLPLKQTYLMMVFPTRFLWMRRLCYALLPRRWNSRLVLLQLAQLKPPPVVQPAELNANKIAVRRPHIRSRKTQEGFTSWRYL